MKQTNLITCWNNSDHNKDNKDAKRRKTYRLLVYMTSITEKTKNW